MQDVPITGAMSRKTTTVTGVVHGGDLGAARRRYPDARLPWIDLSTGINPLPYPMPALPADVWTRLPSQDDEVALIAAAARRYGAPTETIVPAPGTQALIQLLPRLVARSRVAIVGPTYAEHTLCWRREGHDVAVVATLAEAQGADIAVVVNPDNPTGRLFEPTQLSAVTARLLIVDEAFIDLAPAELSLCSALPVNAVVLRSFGKTYGLAGLRLGFAVAPPAFATRLRAALGPWAVSGPALSVGTQALADDAWLNNARARLTAESQRLDGLLAAAGFTVLGGTTLFRLASHPAAASWVERLGQSGIHVRAFAEQPPWLRFGVPSGEETFRRLAAALQVPQ
jgi:cobalamin biosynthetic protein CobC